MTQTVDQSIDQALDANIVMASPLRRIGAMIYDCLLSAAILMIAAVPFLPFNGEDHRLHGAPLYLQRVWLLCIFVAFFVYFWSQKGRTLGMQAWNLWIQTKVGVKPSIRDSILRILWAVVPWIPAYVVLSLDSVVHNPLLNKAGLALQLLVPLDYLIAYLDPQRRAWHDRFLRTQIVFGKSAKTKLG